MHDILISAIPILSENKGHIVYFVKYIHAKYTEILEVNLFAFAYRLFHEDFSPLDGTLLLNLLPGLYTLIWWGF